jgi:acetyltransferase-like isoleucine patch superfamily enzyme
MKTVIKQLLRLTAIFCVLPIYLCHMFASMLTTADASLESCSQLMSLIPGRTGNLLRNAFYRLTLKHCDPTATICFGVLISKTSASIGRNVYVGPRCMLGWVALEPDVLLGPSVQIPSGPHAHTFDLLEIPIRNQPSQPKLVTIGADSWIGAASIVLADVGTQSVVGANSTVTKPIPSKTIAVGSPARAIQSRQSKKHDQSNDQLCDASIQRNVSDHQHVEKAKQPFIDNLKPNAKTPNLKPSISRGFSNSLTQVPSDQS